MSCRSLFVRVIGLSALAAALLSRSEAFAQFPAPDHTWTATASGTWSTASNWTPATVPASANTTILQFNAGGSTSYTATNDIVDPFLIKGILLNSSSSAAVTLDGNNTTGLQFSTATPFIWQNNTGAVTVNNNLLTNNASTGSDLDFGGYGSGTVTITGNISGTGGIRLSNLGNATFDLANGSNAFQGANGLTTPIATYSPFGTLKSSATSGTPFGTSNFVLMDGTVAIAPATTSPVADVTVGLGTGANLEYFAGGTIALNKGGNTSLTFNSNQSWVVVSPNSSASVVIAPASGIANLGLISATTGGPVGETYSTSSFQANTAASVTAPTLVPISPLPNGLMPPTFIGQASGTNTAGDFLVFYATPTVAPNGSMYSGLAQFQGYTNYSTPGGAFGSDTSGTEVSNVTAATTASASPIIQGLRVTGTTLTIATGATVSVAGANWYAGTSLSGRANQSGVILNSATIAGPGTLDFGPAEIDLYGGGTNSFISAPITSTNGNATNPSIVKYGPGNIFLSNPANSFATGAVYTLYSTGALGIVGPGGSNQSSALGTGLHTFVMRGGAFGITGGDYAPAAGTASSPYLVPTFLFVQGGGGFFVDSNSTLTLGVSTLISTAGATTGTGPFYKTGAGTLALTFPFALGGFTGIQVNQGTFETTAALTGNGTGGPGAGLPIPTVVNSAGSVIGTGALPGPVVINGGGTISPGISGTIGALGTGGAVLEPGGSLRFKYNPGTSAPAAGTDNDEITAIAAGSVLDLSNLSSTKKFTVNLVPDVVATPPGSPVTYTVTGGTSNGSFGSVLLPAGVTGANLSSLFNFTGLFNGTPTAALNGNNLTFTFIPAGVTSFTWTGTVSGFWSNGNNWSNTVPPSSNQNTLLTFGATPNPTMTNDITGTLTLNGMTFLAGSPTYSLAGNGLNFVTNSAGGLPQIVSNSSNAVTITAPVTLTNSLTVGGSGNVALNGLIGGTGGLTMNGSGTLSLGNAGNTFTGGVNAQNGVVSVAADGALGTGPVSGASLGTVNFTASTTTTRTFNMNGGTVSVAAGQTLTVNGGQITNGFLDGAGTIATDPTNGAVFSGLTTEPSVAITSNSPKDQFVHVSNSAAVTVAAGVNTAGTSTTINFNGFNNVGLGSVTMGAGSRVNVSNFQSSGTLTLTPGPSSSSPTELTNVGTAPLGFNAGSRTFIATPQTAGQFLAGIDLHGKNAVVAGGLFVNNGFVIDQTGGTATVIADYGALVKGAGFYQNGVITQNGGKFQAGNSPGKVVVGQITLGPGQTQDFNWQINDAKGTAGPSADTNNQVDGWSLISAEHPFNSPGNVTWTATNTPGNKFNLSLQTLLFPTTVGQDVQGAMNGFHNRQTAQPGPDDGDTGFSWPFVQWLGTYTGPTDDATLTADTNFDLSNFVNMIPTTPPPGGKFSLHFDGTNRQIDIVYTVPEPGTLGLCGLGALAAGWAARRRKAKMAKA